MQNSLGNWLRTSALPYFLENGIDRKRGGYFERFSWDGTIIDPGFKRTRVTARQIYCFSHAAIGGVDGAAEAAAHGVDFLLSRAQMEEGVFASRLATNGAVEDATADLYDIAFVLFSLAWWYKFSGDTAVLTTARKTVMTTRERLAHPAGRGFLHRERSSAPYQQNPHMHLLEAAIFLASFSGDPFFHELSKNLFDLAANDFYDSHKFTLREFFGENWSRGDERFKAIVEPGHHFEWSWLLTRYCQLSGDRNAGEMADMLFNFAIANGFDARSGLIVDSVDEDGAVLGSDLRSWPNLEYLKALVAFTERHPEATLPEDIVAVSKRIYTTFLSGHTSGVSGLRDGLWVDYIEGDSHKPKVDHVPASTFYHLTLAITEILRHQAGHAEFSGKPW